MSEEEPKTYSEDYVKNLREEAAGYRTRLRETERTLAETRTELETVNSELTKAQDAAKNVPELELKALKLEVAFESDLPKNLAMRLVGNTKEELQADAKSVAEALPTPHPNLHQGGNQTPEAPNPNDALRALVFGG